MPSFPVAILAGGLATRMRPLTNTIPKALIEVSGRPFLFHQLDYLRRQGVDDVTICVGYKGEMIEDAAGNGSSFGLQLKYVYDGDILLGTAGALRRAIPFLGENFFVLYGDSYLPCDYRAVQKAYETRNKKALMTIINNENQWDKSNVMFRDNIIIEYNKSSPHPKMKHIDYGLSILCADVLSNYPSNTFLDLAEVYHNLSVQGDLTGYEVSQRFYEIGSPQGLKETEEYLSAQTHP